MARRGVAYLTVEHDPLDTVHVRFCSCHNSHTKFEEVSDGERIGQTESEIAGWDEVVFGSGHCNEYNEERYEGAQDIQANGQPLPRKLLSDGGDAIVVHSFFKPSHKSRHLVVGPNRRQSAKDLTEVGVNGRPTHSLQTRHSSVGLSEILLHL